MRERSRSISTFALGVPVLIDEPRRAILLPRIPHHRLSSPRTGLRAAAVNRVSRTRYPARALGGEEENQLRDLRGLPDATDGMRLLRAFEESCVSIFAHPAALVYLCDDDAGIDGVHAYAFRRQLKRGAAR